MFEVPPAIGYLRKDISGTRQPWDEEQIRSVAARLGYDLRKTVVFTADIEHPMHRLRIALARTGAEAVVVPSMAHFDGGKVPDELIAVVDVITVEPEQTFVRWTFRPEL